jgi:hypothetical protein
MTFRKPMIGIGVFHATDLHEEAGLIPDLLAAVDAAAGRNVLQYVHGQFASSDRFSRQQKLSKKILKQLITDVRGRVFRSIQFDELPRTDQVRSSGYTSLHVQLAPAQNPRVGSDEQPVLPYRLHVLLPHDYSGDAARVGQCLEAFARLLDAPYGFAYLGASFRDVLMEVSSVPMFSWGQPMSEADLRRQKRLQRCQTERIRIGSLTCGAYWANLFGENIVRRLGGPELLLRKTPAAILREVQPGLWYVQTTSSLPDLNDPAYQAALAALEAYLAPVSIFQERGTT